jgi:hypothetical protein
MDRLPIVKMTLYKHGVGFYQRRGKVEGNSVTLIFRKEEMNDVLKSLTALTVEGGQVLNVDYETPDDRADRLARSSLQLSNSASLRDLLRDLRGRQVVVDTAGETLQGIVVGVDLPEEREPMAATILSLFKPEWAAVRPVRLAEITSLGLSDARAAGDLAFFLEASLADEEKRALTVRLSQGPSDLAISYIGPCPTWRVSYRLVEDEESGKSEALLQGWGLFDNTFDEDLENVQVKLVAGMPVSFIYDLYNPFTPERPVIEEEARTVAGPVEFAPALGAGLEAEEPRMVGERMAAPRFKAMAAPAAQFSAADLGRTTAVAATAQALGEYFAYEITQPVTVRRGRSAMVPILQKTVTFRKQRIYSAAKQRTNPVVTARIRNDTGLTLERGPVTVVEDGEYAGEAMMPFAAGGTEVNLAYAVDLAVKVSEEMSSERVTISAGIQKGLLVVEEYQAQRTKYRVENLSDAPVDLIIEHPRLANHEAFDTVEPTEVTADAYRYGVHAAAHSAITYAAAQRRQVFRREEIRSQRLEELRRWLHDRVLDESAFEAIQGVLGLYEQVSEREVRLKENEGQRKEIFSQQKAIQGNLGALRDAGEEGELRRRYVRTLNELEDRLGELKSSDEALRQEIQRLQKEIDAALAAF